jgi:hypothetical protein
MSQHGRRFQLRSAFDSDPMDSFFPAMGITMNLQDSETIIGYSVFELFEECYQYNENACYIANTKSAAEAFLKNSYCDTEDCRIDAVTFGDIMADYGASCGEYAMEPEAYSRFKRVAKLNGVPFDAEPFDGDDTLMVVDIDGVAMPDDE